MREYAACVLMALIVGAMFLVVCGIGYLLKVTAGVVVRAIQGIAYRAPTLKRSTISLSKSSVICIGVEPIVVADCPS